MKIDQNSISSQLFKDIVSRFPTGVTVVTTSNSGAHFGLTVNSFASVSLDPPLVLFCINKNAGSYKAFMGSEYFTVNFLSNKQENLARHFASKMEDKFTDIAYYMNANNIPTLDGVLGNIEAKKWAIYDGGDHSIIVGRVISGDVDNSCIALKYYDRKFEI